jgi:hypothetical protein
LIAVDEKKKPTLRLGYEVDLRVGDYKQSKFTRIESYGGGSSSPYGFYLEAQDDGLMTLALENLELFDENGDLHFEDLNSAESIRDRLEEFSPQVNWTQDQFDMEYERVDFLLDYMERLIKEKAAKAA